MNEPSIFPHEPGDTVSTALRYSDHAAYLRAIENQKQETYLAYKFSGDGSTCSFKMPDYTEVLLMWLPNEQRYSTDCKIQYVYLDKTVPGLWIKYTALIAKRRYKGLEGIDESLPRPSNEMDKVRRVVFKDMSKSLRADLDGYIINPPYPPFLPDDSLGLVNVPLITAGALLGIGVLVWLFARRRHRFG